MTALRERSWRVLILVLLVALVGAGCTSGGEEEPDEAGAEGDAALPEATAPVDVGAGAAGTETADDQVAQAGGGGNTLQAVQDRGTLNCGVNDAVPGFGFLNQDGEFVGFDIEFCKVIAAAVLGDAEAVEFTPLTADQRFTALQAGEIDVLVRNTTWTALRDGNEGGAFATTTFYDGQTMMVPADSEFQSVEDMSNTAICVLAGTTTELNLASHFNALGVPFEAVTFQDNDQLIQAFREGRCDGWTSDSSQLAGVRSAWPEDAGGPEALRIFGETFSKEPLGPVVPDGDMQWYDAVNWATIATMSAEEFGITSENVQDMMESEDPEIRRFLGQPGAEGEPIFDPGLGLPADFAVQVVSQVGNYAEIFDRTIGPDTALGLERGVNALWTDGGLHYPPPYR